MEQIPTLKVMRNEDAKQFPLIHIAKDGDVGFDLFAAMPKIEQYQDLMGTLEAVGKLKDMSQYEIDKMTRKFITIQPGCRGVIPTGIHLELPAGYWASIEARSSTSKNMLIVPKGVIDEGYRGELFAVMINVGSEPVYVYHGDRYVQLIIHKRNEVNVIEVDELAPSQRGSSGFGSTGRSV